MVEELIKNNKVVVFSKSYCPFCRKAKVALHSVLRDEQMTVLEVGADQTVAKHYYLSIE